MKKHPKLCKINLFEHILPVETLVIGGLTHTESNVETDWKLPFENLLTYILVLAYPELTYLNVCRIFSILETGFNMIMAMQLYAIEAHPQIRRY